MYLVFCFFFFFFWGGGGGGKVPIVRIIAIEGNNRGSPILGNGHLPACGRRAFDIALRIQLEGGNLLMQRLGSQGSRRLLLKLAGLWV